MSALADGLADITSSVTVPMQCSALVGKRGASSVSKPSCFSSYTVSAVISSACSCLSIPAGTSTVTALATAKITATVTQGITTTTTTTAATATSTVVLTPNFYLLASGGDVDGNYGHTAGGGGNFPR